MPPMIALTGEVINNLTHARHFLRCMSRVLALSGLAEMVCKLSALRGEADMRDRVTSTSLVAIDPEPT